MMRISILTRVSDLMPSSVDVNLMQPVVKDICGPELAEQIERIAIQLYSEWFWYEFLKRHLNLLSRGRRLRTWPWTHPR